jgi:hypothetical protein
MIPLNENDAARTWSEHLGSLAAASPATRRDAAFTQLDIDPPPLPSRRSSILAHLRRRFRAREQAADRLRANEFMAGG